MQSVLGKIGNNYKKPVITAVRSGDTVRVHQKIKEGNKERTQVFEGLVIRTANMNSQTARITVRRVASGIGVEKSYLLHSPLVLKVEVTKRSKVRRNYLSYMRSRTGKAARLSSVAFDRDTVNATNVEAESKSPKDEKTESKDIDNTEPAKTDENKKSDQDQTSEKIQEKDAKK